MLLNELRFKTVQVLFLPGMLNHGVRVGNAYGAVFMVIQKGGTVPCGTFGFTVGRFDPEEN